MAWDINHVVLVGRLTKDPELTYTQSGAAVCRFSIAVNRSSGAGGDNQDANTSFFNIVAWNKTAEICKEYLTKGKQVGIDGRLQQRRWSADDGTRKSNVEIVAQTVQFFGPSRQQQDQTRAPASERVSESFSQEGGPAEPHAAQDDLSGTEQREPFLSELDDEEIPF
jgi:single-strand DNA-binding protein